MSKDLLLRFCLAISGLLALAWFAYLPGLSGGFLFDDWVNLNALGAYGPVDNATTLWRYLTSGVADATGRPLALASFLLDARDWPADPYPFKRTSVLLHLANGALLALLLVRLGRSVIATNNITEHEHIGQLQRVRLAAALGAGLWLLHPLFVSTTLYVVQREAMLPGTFILLGLIGYVVGRGWAQEGKRTGVALAAVSVLLGTLLATLCKANGALLPLLAWVLDAVLLTPRQGLMHPSIASSFLWMRRGVIILPSLVLLALLAGVGVNGFINGVPEVRSWSLAERLLTQPRVVVEYLHLLWMPQPYSNGLFNDAIVISDGWLSPPSTLLSILLLTALVAFAVISRRRWPISAVAILFFFLAHLMESSVVPLELHFEHRNYIPAMLMFWPLGWWLAGAWGKRTERKLVLIRRLLCVLLPLLLAALTFLRADLWGNVSDQAVLWAERNPDSPRAQAYAAHTEMRHGEPALAIKRLEHALISRPHDLQLLVNLVDARCAEGQARLGDIHRLSAALASDRSRSLAFGWLSRKLDALGSDAPTCRGLKLSDVRYLVDSLAANPGMDNSPGRVAEVHHLRGRIALLDGEPSSALASFNTSLNVLPTPAKALAQAALLAEAGHPELGIRHLDKCSPTCGALPAWTNGMPALHARLLQSESYWETEIATLKKDLAATKL